MDNVVFDEQMIDVVTGWLAFLRSGLSVHTCFEAASRDLPDPYHQEWLKLDHDLKNLVHNSLSEGLQHMAQQIPSEALKLVADTSYRNWMEESSRSKLDDDLLDVQKTLWQKFGPRPLPTVTGFNETFKLLHDFSFNHDLLARRHLLEQGDHVLIYLVSGLDLGAAHTTEAVFDLFKALNTPAVYLRLRRYVEAEASPYRQAARELLRELGVHANAPQWTGFKGRVNAIDLYLQADLEPEAALALALKMDEGFQADMFPALTTHATKIDSAAGSPLKAAYDFAADVHLHFDVPHLTDEEIIKKYPGYSPDFLKNPAIPQQSEEQLRATFAALSRTPEGNAVIKKVLRITFDLLRDTGYDLMLVFDTQGLILMRKSGELLLKQSGFWIDASLEEVTLPYQWMQPPAS